MVENDALIIHSDLRPGDLGRILELHGRIYATETGFDLSFEAYVAETLARFRTPPDPATERVWLVEQENRLVGCVAIVRHSPERAQLRWLLVDPAVRGRKLGRTLVNEAVRFTRQAGYRSLFLETIRELPVAARLYREAGFRLVHEEGCLMGGREVTEQRYEQDFPQ